MPNLSMFLLGVVQALILLALAPFFTGFSRMIRARMHSRRGPGVLQDYRDIIKLLKRQDVAPASAGFVFQVTPYVVISVMLLVAMALPVFSQHSPVGVIADLITFAYLFAIVRFFFSLSGVDSGSAYAGLGGIRELTMGVLVEPIMILSLLVVALIERSTNLGSISASISGGYLQSPIAVVLAMIAFGFAVYIEMGKLPFDMAEAEQELQEGPLTEYSGVSLAVLKMGLALKKVVMAQFFISVFLPFGNAAVLDLPSFLIAVVALPIKLAILFFAAGLIENSMARGRFLMASRVTWIGFGVAVLAFVFYLTGL
ncbi:MAG: respiratory chain complex I subunit 1 family protein [Formivibrio sp.]|nr:respiratory chain complex I subunit 1 family protein [Formivibrio sp.]